MVKKFIKKKLSKALSSKEKEKAAAKKLAAIRKAAARDAATKKFFDKTQGMTDFSRDTNFGKRPRNKYSNNPQRDDILTETMEDLDPDQYYQYADEAMEDFKKGGKVKKTTVRKRANFSGKGAGAALRGF